LPESREIYVEFRLIDDDGTIKVTHSFFENEFTSVSTEDLVDE